MSLLLILVFCSSIAHSQMVLEYLLPAPYTQVRIPLSESYNVQINWGDGSAIQTFSSAGFSIHSNVMHTYTTAGIKTLTISGSISKYGTYYGNLIASNEYLTKIKQWKNVGIKDLSFAFCNAVQLTNVPDSLPSTVNSLMGTFSQATSFNQNINTWNTENVTNMNSLFWQATAFNQPLSSWNTSNVTDMEAMFAEDSVFNQPIISWNVSSVTTMGAMFKKAKSFNQPINNWNTSNVIDMNSMFGDASSFNQPLESWNTGNVTNMNFMFFRATSFNQPIGSWNITNVTNMGSMFGEASSFNQPLANWNTSNVTDMRNVFYKATSFNQPISGWNTAKVTTMRAVFSEATSFNQPIGSWNTSNVTDMSSMFYKATSFNQTLGNWNIEKVRSMNLIFNGVSLCTSVYDDILTSWSNQNVITGVSFDGGNSKYSSGVSAARNTIISKGWTITDGGEGTSGGSNCVVTQSDRSNPIINSADMIYPNPVVDYMTIRPKTGDKLFPYHYSIINSLGQKIVENESNTPEINVKELPIGVYSIAVRTIDREFVYRFVKK